MLRVHWILLFSGITLALPHVLSHQLDIPLKTVKSAVRMARSKDQAGPRPITLVNLSPLPPDLDPAIIQPFNILIVYESETEAQTGYRPKLSEKGQIGSISKLS